MSFIPNLRLSNIMPQGSITGPDFNGGGGIDLSALRGILSLRNPVNTPAASQSHTQPTSSYPNLTGTGGRAIVPTGQNVVLGQHALENAQIPNNAFDSAAFTPNGGFGSMKDLVGAQQNQEKIDNTETNNQGKLGISGQRANIYAYKAQHPNMQFKIDKGGNFFAFDPATGKGTDTGIDSGTMSDEDKLRVTGENQINAIDDRGDNTTAAIKARNEGSLADIAARGQQTRDTNSAKTTGNQSPTQAARGIKNTAGKLMNTRPDLASFIQTDPNTGEVKVTPPGPGGFFSSAGPTKQQFDEINNLLYGNGNTSTNSPSASQPKGSSISTKTNKAPDAPSGWKYVPKNGGGWTAVKDSGGGDDE